MDKYGIAEDDMAKMEYDIFLAVSKIVDEFREKTDLSPRSITIQMLDATCFGDKEPNYRIDRVIVSFGTL